MSKNVKIALRGPRAFLSPRAVGRGGGGSKDPYLEKKRDYPQPRIEGNQNTAMEI